MDDMVQALFDWLASVHDYAPIPWDRLPELDLYMDQVITLMDKQLAPFQGEEDRLLTSSMINNYVKGGVLPRPTQKKYARPHLAMLLMIVMLKPVLSLPEIQKAMKGLGAEEHIEELYPDFIRMQTTALREVADRVQSMPEKSEEALTHMAMELALEANARRTAAARILAALREEEPKEARKEKEKEKGK